MTGPAVVVLTVARDEGHMLTRWVTYYGAQVGLENLVVFDDGSTDGSTQGLGCTVHRIPGFPPGKFEAARLRLVSGVGAGLLNTYDVVVFVDVDEFLIPDPELHTGLRAYLRARGDATILAPLGLNVLHEPRSEGGLDPGRPVLGQRRFAKFAPVMCKPSIKRVPAPWAAASHGVKAPFVVDPELFMVHLKFADLQLLREVSERRHRVMTVDGRGKNASWSRTGDEMAAMLMDFVGGDDAAAAAPEFDPRSVDLSGIVTQEDNLFRTPRESQLTAMRKYPLVRVPERLHGIV